jgi:hypothetical protein
MPGRRLELAFIGGSVVNWNSLPSEQHTCAVSSGPSLDTNFVDDPLDARDAQAAMDEKLSGVVRPDAAVQCHPPLSSRNRKAETCQQLSVVEGVSDAAR